MRRKTGNREREREGVRERKRGGQEEEKDEKGMRNGRGKGK